MNVIASAFAFRPNYGSSTQLGKKNDKEKLDIYIKNIVVSLTSAKLHNPGDEVMLVTNQEPPLDCRKQLEQAGVGISIISYDAYVMPERFAWSLAFFKLCALTYLARQEYEKILLIDADTITVDAYSELWQEMEYGMMLYPVNHSFHHQARKEIREDAVRLGYGEEGNVIHYGGEFVGGNKAALTEFLTLCESVFTGWRKITSG